MKFGKLQNIENVEFTLPKDPLGTLDLLDSLKAKEKVEPNIYIGCTGWSMKEWVGKVYSKGTKTKDYLQQYTKQFNTIELNTTHYRIPNEATIEKWKKESTDDFRFCPKILQRISHSSGLGYGTGLVTEFCNAIGGLEEKLGCCFMQLPPYFGTDRIAVLEAFLKQFPTSIPLAIEFRHESWFNDKNNLESIAKLLEQYKVPTVITDVAGRRDVLHMRLTTNTAMIRFVGNNLHPTDYSRIDEWTERLKIWSESGVNEMYFFPHEPDNLLAPELCEYLVKQINKKLSIQVRGPQLINEDEGKQISLF